jgi:hypothetical protein
MVKCQWLWIVCNEYLFCCKWKIYEEATTLTQSIVIPSLSFFITINQILCITRIKQLWFQKMPYLCIAPMFAFNISWVLFPINPTVSHNLSSNHFMYTMIGKCFMPFVQWRVGKCTICNNCLLHQTWSFWR